MANGYFVKNEGELQKLDSTTPDESIIKEVSVQIKALGDNTKANYEELNKRHNELKQLLDSYDGKYITGDQLEKVKKLTDDISVRQDAIDQNMTKRMDSIEVALQRVGSSGLSHDDIDLKDVHDFYINAATVRKRGGGLINSEVDDIKSSVSIDEYRNYQKNFNNFLRRKESPINLTPEERKMLSVGVDPDGGYTVTPAMSNAVITKLFEMDPMRELASVETITTMSLDWLVDWGQAGYGWEEETVAGAETTTPQFNKKSIVVHVMYAKPRASQVLLEDSGINIESWLANKVADRFGRAEAAAFVTGDGVGKPRGFLTYSNGTTYGTIPQVAMGAAAALTADGFISVKYNLIEQYLNRGTWLMNRSTVAAAMKLKDGDGNYIWKPGLTSDQQSTILSLPVRMSTSMTAISTNTLSVALADWKETYMIVDRLGITIQRDPYTQKPMVEFYTRKRVGGDVVNYQSIVIGKISAS